MRIRSVLRHSFQALLEGALVALLVVGLIAGTAIAGKSGGGGRTSGSSVSVVALDSTDGVPHQGQNVTFKFSTSNPYPVISLHCTRGGDVIYGNSGPMYWPNLWDFDGVFTLASQAWTEGAADCRADLKGTSHGKTVNLGSTSFHVDP
jgi:hypothetical protein